jgi:hypothetical protein
MTDEGKIKKMRKMAEEFFGTQIDPDQIPINNESIQKLISIRKDTILSEVDENESPISWIVVIPTSIRTMDRFLKKDINERQLLDEAVREKKFEALYLCSAFTVLEHRKKGLAKKLILKAISKFANDKNIKLYAWPYSKEGKAGTEALSKFLNRNIFLR